MVEEFDITYSKIQNYSITLGLFYFVFVWFNFGATPGNVQGLLLDMCRDYSWQWLEAGDFVCSTRDELRSIIYSAVATISLSYFFNPKFDFKYQHKTRSECILTKRKEIFRELLLVPWDYHVISSFLVYDILFISFTDP